MKSIRLILTITLTLFLAVANVNAKDLRGKLGVGFNSQLTAGGISSISAKYWMSEDIAFQGIFGFASSDHWEELDMAGKVLFKIRDERNLHVDAFGALGLIRYDPDPGDSDTGLAIAGGLSIEYFFSGLPNLGFSSEIGLEFSDIDDNTTFKTMSGTFITAGIHYYFHFMAPPGNEPMQ